MSEAQMIRLHDFPGRGMGEQIRVALSFFGAEFEEVPIDFSEMKSNFTIYPFGQCPRLEDGKISIVQSQVILRYIAKKYGFLGSSLEEELEIECILEGVAALRQSYFELVYTDNMAPDKMEAHWAAHGEAASRSQRNGGAHWGYLSALLTKNSPDGRGPPVGQSFSVADTSLFELTHAYLSIFGTEMRETYPEVVAHHDNMADHPKIREYLARGERKDEFMPEWTNKIDLPRGSWSAAA